MILYRGSIEPETMPKRKRFGGVFFAPNFKFAAEYGAYVNKYRAPRPEVLEFGSPESSELIYQFMGYRPSRKENDPVELGLFWHPRKDWAEFVLSAGYTATAMGWNMAFFDMTGFVLLERWYTTWDHGTLHKKRMPLHDPDA